MSKIKFVLSFFFNSCRFATKIGEYALEDEKRKGHLFKDIWITKCTTREPIKLLDLRDSFFCIELLAALDKAGFAIFVDELKSWQGKSFSKLKSIIQPVEEIVLNDNNPVNNEKVKNAIKEMFDVLKIEMTNIGHLLQMFTDYSNGYYFRRLLQSKGSEGYIFNETNTPIPIKGSDTICIFESTKFYPPCIELMYPLME